jgi:hypothetical protein
MPSDIRDVTDQYVPDLQRPSPLIVCNLKRALAGTVCFPYGLGFGCGSALEVSKGEEISLELTLGAEAKGLSGAVTYGTTFTSTVTWSYTSDKCEYYRPEICFPESRLFIYECERFLSFWSWTTIDEIFEPGPQGELRSNCTPNDPICRCVRQTSAITPSGGGGRLAQLEGGAHATVMTPTGFARRPGFDEPSDPGETAELFRRFPHATSPWSGRRALGTVSPRGGIEWLYPATAEQPRLSLLTHSCLDQLGGSTPRRLTGRFLPVLAATSCHDEITADASLDVLAPDGSRDELRTEVEVRHGVATLLWAELDLGRREREPGTKANLTLTTRDRDGCVRDILTEAYEVAPHPPGP